MWIALENLKNPFSTVSDCVNEDYKNHSHGKQMTFPQYTMEILGIRISLRNPG